MASQISDDTRKVREEFDGLSTPTQIFVAVLVALGILLGALLGYWLAVDEVDGNCIEYQDEVYCLEAEEAD